MDAFLWIGSFFVVAALWVLSVRWTYRDAQLRGKPAWLAALLAGLFFWPIGWMIWLRIRPGAGETLGRLYLPKGS